MSRGQPFAGDPLELLGEAGQFHFRKRQPGGEGMTAEADDHSRRTLGHQIQCVPQMKAGDGAPGTAKLAVSSLRKHDHRTVIAILEPRRDDADHALMPFPPVKA